MKPQSKLRIYSLIALLIFISISCNNSQTKKQIASEFTRNNIVDAPVNSIFGTYVGFFQADHPLKVYNEQMGDSDEVQPNKITMFIQKMDDGHIEGWSVCAGNDRPFKGTYTEDKDEIKATVEEPGNGKYDGEFTFQLYKTSFAIVGNWKPFNTSQGSKHYRLFRKNFSYNVSAGDFPEASERLLKSADVENMYKEELRIMRNEIYARHGYSFKLPDMRSTFDHMDWYIPISTDVRKTLTSVELKNEVLIKRYEKYAEDHYDDYGR